jgi:hypothetical protein
MMMAVSLSFGRFGSRVRTPPAWRRRSQGVLAAGFGAALGGGAAAAFYFCASAEPERSERQARRPARSLFMRAVPRS